MTKKLPRTDFLKMASSDVPDMSQLDDLDKKALEGYTYLEDVAEATDHLKNIDARFAQLMASKQEKPKTRIRKLSSLRIQRIAAAVLILLIPAYFLFKGPSHNALFAEHFQAPRSTYFQQSRGEQQTADAADLRAAFKLYETGSYAEAQQAINRLKDAHPDKLDLVYYEALAALGADNVEQAIELLKQCLTIEYQNVDDRTPWYLALAHLKNGDIEQAKEWLQQVSSSNSRFRDRAQDLLKDLN